MKQYSTTVAAIFVAAVALAQPVKAAEGSLSGWDEARFGMTLEEIIAAYPNARTTFEENHVKRLDTDIEDIANAQPIAPIDWTAQFWFADDRLFGVHLSGNAGLYQKGEARILEATTRFQELMAALVRRYGSTDLLLTDRGDLGSMPTVGRAVWRFEDGNSLTASGQIMHGRWRPLLQYGVPYEFGDLPRF